MSLLMSVMTVFFTGCSVTAETSPKAETHTWNPNNISWKKLHDIIIPELIWPRKQSVMRSISLSKPVWILIERIPDGTTWLELYAEALKQNIQWDPIWAAHSSHDSNCGSSFHLYVGSLKLVCDATGMKFYVRGYWVWIVPLVDPISPNNDKGK